MRAVVGGQVAVGLAVGAFRRVTGEPADAARMDERFRRLVAGAH
jgi:hypothetical protein